jgi:glycosyltransferase involved in cell wall biosynthesis
MTANERKISILMALKNASKNFDISIRSVTEQNYLNYEFIFAVAESEVDKNSKIKDLADKYPVKILLGQNRGIYPALNNGLLIADPDSLVCILGAGDFFLHQDVFNQVNLALRHDTDWCISPWVFTDENYEFLEISGAQNYDGMALLTRQVPHCHQTVFAGTRLILENGAFNPSYQVAADRDLIFKLWRTKPPEVLNLINVVYPRGGFSSRNSKRGHYELRRLQLIRLITFPFISSKWKQNLKSRNLHASNVHPKEIFKWCPVRVKAGISHRNNLS